MKAKYRRGTRYMWAITFSFNPVGMPPGCGKISTINGSFVLKTTKTASDMYALVMEQARVGSDLPIDHPIFPSFYHVEEQYGLI